MLVSISFIVHFKLNVTPHIFESGGRYSVLGNFLGRKIFFIVALIVKEGRIRLEVDKVSFWSTFGDVVGQS